MGDLSFDEFITKLKKQYEYLQDGGTIYRQQTAKLSLEVALKVRKVTLFLDPDESRRIVSNYLSYYDQERKNDVSKMLWMIAKSIYLEKTTPDEVKEYVNNKMKNKAILKKHKK